MLCMLESSVLSLLAWDNFAYDFWWFLCGKNVKIGGMTLMFFDDSFTGRCLHTSIVKFRPMLRFGNPNKTLMKRVSQHMALNGVPFRLIPGVRCTKRKFFGSLGATDTRKLNFNFKVLNRRIFTRRIRIFVDPAGVQRNNRFFQYKY